ncbi:unnamed protein product [Caretta caretta]
MLQKSHEDHLGIEKCKQRAREVPYWPQINHDITNVVGNCFSWLRYKPCQQAEPLRPHPVPQRPYEKVNTDLFTWQSKDYLIVTDYYSLYPEICTPHNANSKSVIAGMKGIFSRHGIPDEVFSDNELQI